MLRRGRGYWNVEELLGQVCNDRKSQLIDLPPSQWAVEFSTILIGYPNGWLLFV
jgi:hypothetical protein